MQWPVYSLAEHGAQIIRDFHNGVPDPDDPNNSSGGNNDNNSNNGTNTNNNNNTQGGASSFSTPSVLTSALVLLFATLAVVL